MPGGRAPKLDWGAIASGAGNGSRAVRAAGVPGGVPTARGDRVTILVGSDPTGGTNDNHRLLQHALRYKSALSSSGIVLRAQEFSLNEQVRQKGRLAELGVTRFPTAVATIGGERQLAVGVRNGTELLATLAAQGPPEEGNDSVEQFYDKELRSRDAWVAAAGNADESEEIRGVGSDIAAEYQAAIRARTGGQDAQGPTASEAEVAARATSGDAATAAALGETGAPVASEGPAVSHQDGAAVAAAIAAVAEDEDAADVALMSTFWESNTPSD